MSKDFLFLFVLIAIGLMTRKMTWRGWFSVGIVVFLYIMYMWKRG